MRILFIVLTLAFLEPAHGQEKELIFADDFESGSTSAWSATISGPPPVAIFGANPNPAEEDELIEFDASESLENGGGPLTYTWDFGDGTNGSGVAPTHVYAESGSYTVTLSVFNANGHSAPAGSGLLVGDGGTCSGPCVVTNLHTTFSDDAKTSAWVSWRGQTGAFVRYGTTTGTGQVALGSSFESFGDQQNHVELTNLDPGTRYFYEVGGTEAGGYFTTAPDGTPDFTFAAIGDIQYGPTLANRWIEAHEYFTSTHDPDFFITLGDQVSKGLRQSDWDWFFLSSEPMVRTTHMMPNIGNHELRHPDVSGHYLPEIYLDTFRVPRNGHPEYGNWFYHFEYGDVLFVVLAWREDIFPLIYEEQTAWMESVLAETTKKWKLIFLHQPSYTVFRGGVREDLHPDWSDVWDAYGVNAVFSGDTHFYEYSVPINDGALAPSYADGILYYGAPSIRNSTDESQDAWFVADKALLPDVKYQPLISVTDDSITVTTYDYGDGSVRSEVVLPPRNPTRPDSPPRSLPKTSYSGR